MENKNHKNNIEKISTYSDDHSKNELNKSLHTFFVFHIHSTFKANNNFHPYECKICNPIKSYKTMSSLVKHFRNSHKKKLEM